MGWATEQATKIITEERRQAEERSWQIHCAAVIAREAPMYFNCLTAQIEEYISEFNAACVATVQFEKSELSVSVTKSDYPSRHVRLDLIEGGVRVYSRSIGYAEPPVDSQQAWRFHVQRDGVAINLDGASHDAIAKRVLGPIFQAFRPFAS
jgi:hypothetical protein